MKYIFESLILPEKFFFYLKRVNKSYVKRFLDKHLLQLLFFKFLFREKVFLQKTLLVML